MYAHSGGPLHSHHSAAQRSTAQHSAAQRSTAQHSAAQHNRVQNETCDFSLIFCAVPCCVAVWCCGVQTIVFLGLMGVALFAGCSILLSALMCEGCLRRCFRLRCTEPLGFVLAAAFGLGVCSKRLCALRLAASVCLPPSNPIHVCGVVVWWCVRLLIRSGGSGCGGGQIGPCARRRPMRPFTPSPPLPCPALPCPTARCDDAHLSLLPFGLCTVLYAVVMLCCVLCWRCAGYGWGVHCTALHGTARHCSTRATRVCTL
jgi:hypothetical protein